MGAMTQTPPYIVWPTYKHACKCGLPLSSCKLNVCDLNNRKPHRQCITPHINSQNGVSVLDRHWTVPSKNLTANAFSRYTLDGSSDQSTLEGSTQKPHCRCFQPRYFGLLLQPINFGWITNPPNGITVDVFSQYT
jgi:hypothetical protein